MILPTSDQYIHVFEKRPPGSFSSLRDYRFVFTELDGQKKFFLERGFNALVLKAEKNGRWFALRFFLDGEQELFDRYRETSRYLNQLDGGWKTGFEFLDKEVCVNDEYYPVLKMDWVDSLPLHQYLDIIEGDTGAITKLQARLVQLSRELEASGVAHGNLNFKHLRVLIDDLETIKLIDYDAMFIPAFEGRFSLSPGSPGFQHPRRLASDYSATIDRFSIWVLLTGLEALKTDPTLWKEAGQFGYNKNENLLFLYKDLAFPNTSRIFQLLRNYNSEALGFYVDKLQTFCMMRNLEEVEAPFLFDEGTVKEIAVGEPETILQTELQTILETEPQMAEIEAEPVTEAVPTREEAHPGEPLNEIRKELAGVVKEQEPATVLVQKHRPAKTAVAAEVLEENEIIFFEADRYEIVEGEPVTLRWEVQGEGRLHISGLGFLYEKSGSKNMALKYTTDFVLTLGELQHSFTVTVHPKKKELFDLTPVEIEKPKKQLPAISKKVFLLAFAVLAGTALLYFISRVQGSENAALKTAAPAKPKPVLPQSVLFSQADVNQFLFELYQAYNKKDLDGILPFYADHVQQYYDVKNISRDSLSTIINELFVKPEHYETEPVLRSLQFTSEGERCRINITIRETIKTAENNPPETYTSSIEYIIDKFYNIVSEKAVLKKN